MDKEKFEQLVQALNEDEREHPEDYQIKIKKHIVYSAFYETFLLSVNKYDGNPDISKLKEINQFIEPVKDKLTEPDKKEIDDLIKAIKNIESELTGIGWLEYATVYIPRLPFSYFKFSGEDMRKIKEEIPEINKNGVNTRLLLDPEYHRPESTFRVDLRGISFLYWIKDNKPEDIRTHLFNKTEDLKKIGKQDPAELIILESKLQQEYIKRYDDRISEIDEIIKKIINIYNDIIDRLKETGLREESIHTIKFGKDRDKLREPKNTSEKQDNDEGIFFDAIKDKGAVSKRKLSIDDIKTEEAQAIIDEFLRDLKQANTQTQLITEQNEELELPETRTIESYVKSYNKQDLLKMIKSTYPDRNIEDRETKSLFLKMFESVLGLRYFIKKDNKIYNGLIFNYYSADNNETFKIAIDKAISDELKSYFYRPDFVLNLSLKTRKLANNIFYHVNRNFYNSLKNIKPITLTIEFLFERYYGYKIEESNKSNRLSKEYKKLEEIIKEISEHPKNNSIELIFHKVTPKNRNDFKNSLKKSKIEIIPKNGYKETLINKITKHKEIK